MQIEQLQNIKFIKFDHSIQAFHKKKNNIKANKKVLLLLACRDLVLWIKVRKNKCVLCYVCTHTNTLTHMNLFHAFHIKSL